MRDGTGHGEGIGRAGSGDLGGPVTPAMLIQDVLLRFPETRATFAAWRLPCPRCLASGYETVGQLAVTIGIDGAAFIADLNRAIAAIDPDAWRWPGGGLPPAN